MTKRTIRIGILSLSIVGLVAADVITPLVDGVRTGRGLVSADSSTTATTPQRRRRRRRRIQPGKLIPRRRVLQIQRALIERGFLNKATGKYEASTVRAMKAFQTSQNIDATGYPTAHVLDRLGLSPKFTTTPPKPSEGAAPTETGQSQK